MCQWDVYRYGCPGILCAQRMLLPVKVLLDSTGYAKLCDLGFARFVLSPLPSHPKLVSNEPTLGDPQPLR